MDLHSDNHLAFTGEAPRYFHPATFPHLFSCAESGPKPWVFAGLAAADIDDRPRLHPPAGPARQHRDGMQADSTGWGLPPV